MNDAPEDDELSLRELLQPLLDQWKLMLAAPVVAGALGVAASYLITPVFSSTTTFLPPQQQQSSAASALASLGSLAGLAGGAAGIKSPAEQYMSLMQSVTVADRLIDKFNLLTTYEAKFRQDARKTLAANSQISVGKKDGLITVSVEDTNPQQAAAMANQYVEELRRMTQVLAVSEAQQRRVFFEKQLQEAKTRLTTAQTVLQDSGFNAGALKAEPKAAAEAYGRLRAELATAEIRLRTMRTTLADASPEVLQLTTTVQSLRQRLAEQEASAGGTGGKDADYVGRFREFKYQETMFELMAKQYELARVDESREGSLIQVVDVAQPAERKSKPKRSVFVIAGGFLGAALAAALVLWRARRSSV
ncbi:MAG: lipopolysaccharide biosynthesis protein [Burkholderiales bacterium]|nr:lipopolysaccharide biosynthesis protein [Burkholderiales bacterium]